MNSFNTTSQLRPKYDGFVKTALTASVIAHYALTQSTACGSVRVAKNIEIGLL